MRPQLRRRYDNPQIQKIKKIFIFTLGFLIGAAVIWIVFTDKKSGIDGINIVSDHVIIDVCTEQEWAAGHHKDAIRVDYERIVNIPERILTDKSRQVHVYARNKLILDQVVNKLIEKGYTVKSLGIWTA